MALRIAIVGPGRVGLAFARILRAAGDRIDLLGVIGRDHAAAEREQQLAGAHVVVLAVGDPDLPAVVAQLAPHARACSLWLHTSGRHGLEVLAPVQSVGARIGSLHPLCPFADADGEQRAMRGAKALLAGEPRSMRLLHRLSEWLGLEAIVCGEQDRALYHAACALAANGATALFGLATDAMRAAGGLAEGDGERIVQALFDGASSLSQAHGAARALSGPVRRGDAQTVQCHLDVLQQQAPHVVDGYRALMIHALQLAERQQLSPDLARAVRSTLEGR